MNMNKERLYFPQMVRISRFATQVGRFGWHYIQMMLAMVVGMLLFNLLRSQVIEPLGYAVSFERGKVLYNIGMAIFMTVPMVVWMIGRGHGWRHSAEMAGAMLLPTAFVILLCWLGVDAYLPWLEKVLSYAMYAGMLVMMLYRRDHYTGQASHSMHAAHH